MINNSQDKGYMWVQLKKIAGEWHLRDLGFTEQTEEEPFFYVDFENGKIFIETDSGKSIIGTYQTTSGPYGTIVCDYPSNRIIGHVSDELIYFRRKNEDYTEGRYSPEEDCLAYYTKNGSITALSIFPYWGCINGSLIGGAAAFVALFYNYNFKSVFRDYFVMDNKAFHDKHASYMNPLGI